MIPQTLLRYFETQDYYGFKLYSSYYNIRNELEFRFNNAKDQWFIVALHRRLLEHATLSEMVGYIEDAIHSQKEIRKQKHNEDFADRMDDLLK